MKLNKSNYVVLTGAPGVGKTTLVNELRASGLTCVDEPAREILAEQRAKNSDGIPERNPKKFTSLLMARSIREYERYQEESDLIVFDRGVIDSIGYATLFGIDTTVLQEAGLNYRYNSRVFVLSPWQEIYLTDEERKMSFVATIQFHKQILEAYEKFNYELIEVPKVSVKERAQFIIDKLEIRPK